MNRRDEDILTVLTPATSYDLTTLDAVKTELGVTSSKNDARFRSWITRASLLIAQYCNRTFAIESLQEEFWSRRDSVPHKAPNGPSPLQLRRWPLVAVTSVIENAAVSPQTLVDGTDYRVNYEFGQLIRLGTNSYPLSWHTLPVQVLYTAGYDLAKSKPADLEHAALTMVKLLYFGADRDPRLMSNSIQGIGDNRWWVATGAEAGMLPPEVVAAVNPYRVPVAA